MKKLFLILSICSLLIIAICVGLKYSTHPDINKGSQEIDSLNIIDPLKTIKNNEDYDEALDREHNNGSQIDSLNTIDSLKTIKEEVDINEFVELKVDLEELYRIKFSSESYIHKAHKQVLIIAGDDTNYNECNLMCNRFADGAKEVGGEVEIVYLCDYGIPYYHSDDIYQENYSQLDESIDTDSIIHKMIKADIIVFEETISSIRAELDSGRIGYLHHRYGNSGLEIRDKEFFYMITLQQYQVRVSYGIHIFRHFAGTTINAIERGYALNPQEAYELGKSI